MFKFIFLKKVNFLLNIFLILDELVRNTFNPSTRSGSDQHFHDSTKSETSWITLVSYGRLDKPVLTPQPSIHLVLHLSILNFI